IVVIIEIIALLPIIFVINENSLIIDFFKVFMPEKMIRLNFWIYNIYSIISFFIFLFFYWLLTKGSNHNKYIFFLIVIYLIAVIIDHKDHFIDISNFFKRRTMHKIAGVLCTLVAAFMYLQTVFKRDDIFTFHKTLPFWITVGLLFFNLVTIPIFIFAQQLNFSKPIYIYILTLSNYIMYGSFIIGFIKNARLQKQNSSLTN